MLQISLVIIAGHLVLGYVFYLLTRRPVEPAGGLLSACLLCHLLIEIFDLLVVRFPQDLHDWRSAALVCEGSLPALWLFFSKTFYREGGLRRFPLFQWLLLLASICFLLVSFRLSPEVLYYSPDFADEKVLFLNRSGYLFYVVIMIAMIVTMVALERTFSCLSPLQRWQVKFELVGAGVILVMSLGYYSQAVLYRSLDMSLSPARTTALILAIVLMAYSRFKRGKGTNIVLSRKVAFRSIVIFLVGFYLFGLGLAGEGLRYLGLPSQKLFFSVVGMFSGVAFLVLLLSEEVRRKIKTSIHRNFYRSQYDYRNQWLSFTEQIAGAVSPAHLQTSILAFFCGIFGLKGASLYWRAESTGDFKKAVEYERGPEDETIHGNCGFVKKLKESECVLVVQELNRDEDDCNSFFEDVSYLVPMFFESQLTGFIALGLPVDADEKCSFEDLEFMQTLGKQTSLAILNQQLSEQLAVGREMAAIGRVSTFVMHDLKNLVSNLNLVLENARHYLDDPEFREDMFATLDNSAARMSGVIERLQNIKDVPGLRLTETELKSFVEETLSQAGLGEIRVAGAETWHPVDKHEIEKVVLNLVANARDASGGHRDIEIEVGPSPAPFILCRDRGCGMSEDFVRNQLFRPFNSTKPKGLGIGLYQCRQIVEAHGGRFEVKSSEGEGSEFKINFAADSPARG